MQFLDEENRIKDLLSYDVLDSLPEVELDEIVKIASAIFDTPISLISLVDTDRQWFKAKTGLEVSETHRDYAFCNYALSQPEEVLIVEDSLLDKRFKDNPLVKGDPNIRFYAGAPLKSLSGNVLGTLCVIDRKPRKLSIEKQNALKLMANWVMRFLDQRKLYLESSKKLDRIQRMCQHTEHINNVFVQIEIDMQSLAIKIPFINKKISDIVPEFNLDEIEKNPSLLFELVHKEDHKEVLEKINESKNSLNPFEAEMRLRFGEGRFKWYRCKAVSENTDGNSIVWYFTAEDISGLKDYENAVEDILFYISHELRNPTIAISQLCHLLEEEEELNPPLLRTYAKHMLSSAKLLDAYIKMMNNDFLNKKRLRYS